jgi:hypothetical protein
VRVSQAGTQWTISHHNFSNVCDMARVEFVHVRAEGRAKDDMAEVREVTGLQNGRRWTPRG